MKIVVTGFEPFEGVPHNPSQALVAQLPRHLPHLAVHTEVLPVDHVAVLPRLQRLWRTDPDVLVHLGVASNGDAVRLETRAQNRLHFQVPDNGGQRRRDEPIQRDGPDFLGTRLPVEPLAADLESRGHPVRLSADAGAFLCNQVMYASLYHLPRRVWTGFIHIPPDEHLTRATGGQACPMTLEEQVEAVARLVERCMELRRGR